MPTANADGIHRTDPIKTRASDTPDWSGWEAWMEGHKNIVYEAVGEVIGETAAGLEKRIKGLELQIAEMRGTLDVLRAKGVPGALRVCGTFNSGATYCLNDIVAFNGSSWCARKDSPGPIPGDGWQLIASQGKRGPAGERGPAGPAGIPPVFAGACFNKRGMEIQTSTGPIPLFKSINVDPQSFAIKFIANDDSTLVSHGPKQRWSGVERRSAIPAFAQ